MSHGQLKSIERKSPRQKEDKICRAVKPNFQVSITRYSKKNISVTKNRTSFITNFNVRFTNTLLQNWLKLDRRDGDQEECWRRTHSQWHTSLLLNQFDLKLTTHLKCMKGSTDLWWTCDICWGNNKHVTNRNASAALYELSHLWNCHWNMHAPFPSIYLIKPGGTTFLFSNRCRFEGFVFQFCNEVLK